MPRLVVGKGRSKGEFVDLPESGEVVVGRDLNNALPIRDVQASRRHFKIVVADGRIRLEDLNSVNGSWVNGAKLEQSPLEVGDQVRIGETILYVVGDQEDDDRGELTGQTIAGYSVGRLLGRGAMGHVYEAVQLSLERKVAFKVLAKDYAEDEAFVRSFLEEARFAGRLNHQNIVQVYDVGESGGTYFYSLELMGKGSVEDLIRAETRLPIEVVLPIAIDAAKGLEYAEKKGLIHRDIKPANLFLSADDITKIGDLGIAQRFEAGTSADQEVVSGSPHYIAPEQALGKPIDQRVDLYALGVSIFEMLTGETPYSGRKPQAIILEHINSPTPRLADRLPGVPPVIADIVWRLMAKEPEKRIASATDLLAELTPLLAEFPPRTTALIRLQGDLGSSGRMIQATPPGPTDVAPPTPRSPLPWGKLLGCGCLVLLLGGLGLGAAGVAARSKKAREEREGLVRELIEKLEGGQLEAVTERAPALAKRLEAEGYGDLAERLNGAYDKAVADLADKAAAAREEDAADRLASIVLKAQSIVGKTREPKEINELVEAVEAFMEEFSDTEQRKPAITLHARLLEARDQLAKVLEREAEDLAAYQKAIRELNRTLELRAGEKRFGAALEEIDKFRAKYPGEQYQTTAKHFEEQTRGRAKTAFTALKKEVAALLRTEDIEGARRRVKDARATMGLPELDRDFQALERFVSETEEAFARQAAERKRKADEVIVASKNDEVAAAVTDRRFRAAAAALRDIRFKLSVPDLRERTEQRALVFEAAQDGLQRLISHISESKRESGITQVFQVGNEEKVGIAAEASAEGISFEVSKGVFIPAKFKDYRPPELLVMFERVSLDEAGRVDLACLAWALGELDDARRRSAELGGGEAGAPRDRLTALRALLP